MYLKLPYIRIMRESERGKGRKKEERKAEE